MTDAPKYYDLRSDFWRRHFEMALDYAVYLSTSDPDRAARWEDMEPRIPHLDEAQRRRLTGHRRRLNVLVHSAVWCGDCVRQGPMLRRIADACGPEVRIRFLDRESSPALTDELRMLGGNRVPVAVFLSEDFYELGRCGDRGLVTYRAKRERECGPACASGHVAPPEEQLAAEQEEWVCFFERMLLMLRLAPELRARYDD